ncbi:aspartate aminotransferase family protein [Pseudomonas typographi]|uniref:aspartate aminotransferase family protein n=1 Tax=Pseudomonas typographi TaxID=2715964 RepID=UPI0016855970|nr:aminotransferase class III-fold pyridoxal phosphate-dependent enzyme [Pseudomonas typographi]MBD1587053.1 aminotransferase class III-fold pyridoxal phosphate-dependent enzyme [Pseudomonas typographi]
MDENMTVIEQYRDAVEHLYRSRTSQSAALHEQAKAVLPGGVTRFTNFYPPYPLTMVAAKGCMLLDADGHDYLDFVGNYGSLIHGHTNPAILEAVRAQLGNGTAIAASIPEHTRFAQMICARIPSAEMVRFCNSGLEATMYALRVARAYSGKSGFIKMQGGYHGLHDAVEFSTSAQGPDSVMQPNCPGIAPSAANEIFVVPFNDLAAVETTLQTHGSHIGTIMLEPVMGAAGMILPAPGYLQGLRALADKYQCVLIFDEIQTLRMGEGGAQALYGVTPDLTTIAKIIGGGFPVGAVCGLRKVMSLFDPSSSGVVNHGGTFSGNNISLVAGLKAMELLDGAAITRLESLSAALEQGIQNALSQLHSPCVVTRAGSMLHIHFARQAPQRAEPAAPYAAGLYRVLHVSLLNNGVFISPRGTLYVSTAMNAEHIALATRTIEAAVPAMNAFLAEQKQ